MTGWFADIDKEARSDYAYQPCLQLNGMCLSFDVWFATEEECLDFIHNEVIGQVMYE